MLINGVQVDVIHLARGRHQNATLLLLLLPAGERKSVNCRHFWPIFTGHREMLKSAVILRPV
jgi:hypothetical protein